MRYFEVAGYGCYRADFLSCLRTNHWVKASITIPKEWQDKEWVQLEFDPGCEVSEELCNRITSSRALMAALTSPTGHDL